MAAKITGVLLSSAETAATWAAALLHYLGISRTRKGYWYIRWIWEWGQMPFSSAMASSRAVIALAISSREA